MRKSLKKVLAVAVSAAMAVALLAGVELSSKTAQAAGVDLPVFSFEQGGQYNPSEPGNEGYITSVKMHGTDETIEGWLTGEGSMEQKQYAKQPSNGFDLEIANTGWDATWGNKDDPNDDKINPWAIMASTEGIAVEAGHMYTISFNAHATSKKYALVDFKGTGGLVGDASIGIMGEGNTPDNDPYIELTTEDKPFTFTVTNFVSAEKMDIVWMLGAFDAQVDYAGTPMTDHFSDFATETGWKGTVTVSNVTLEDIGGNPEFVAPPAPDNGGSTGGNNNGGSTGGNNNSGSTGGNNNGGSTGGNNNGGSTGGNNNGGSTGDSVTGGTNSGTTGGFQTKVAKPAKVKIKKAVNLKGRKIKVTWKKVKGATKYQVKVGTKKKTTKKTTYTMKKLKKKTYKVYVRAYNKAGYGKWSKGKKVKVKK